LPGLRVARQHASCACADSVVPGAGVEIRSGPCRAIFLMIAHPVCTWSGTASASLAC